MTLKSDEAPAGEWLDDTVGVLRDGTNLGALRCGEQTLLIDCGSGAVLERLPTLGIGAVAWVLATHYHRDSCSGLQRCREQGARLAVPAGERDLFEAVERHWTAPTSLFHRYRLRPGANVLPRSVAVDKVLADGDVFSWERHAIRVVGTPGHTDGSLSYVVDGGNERIAFVGDLLYAGGRFWELWSLQGPLPHDPVGSQDYHGFCGRGRQAVQSLERLLEQYSPTRLVPAHGPVISDPAAALAALRDNLEALLANYYCTSSVRYYFGEWTARQMGTAPQVLPGQLATPPTWYRVIRGTTRAIVAPSGRALLMDSAGPAVAEHVSGLVASGAISGVDAVWISHYHDDHVGGIAALTAQTGCAVWAHRRLVDILEHPDAYCMPGLDPTIIPVDRVLEEGDRLTWEGFTLSAYEFPGQTIHHAEARAALRERERLLQRLLPWEHPNFGLDPQWARAYPYRQTLAADARGAVTLRFSNYAASTLHVNAVWTVPAGWTVQQPAAGQIAPGTEGALVVGFVVPPDTPPARFILTADVSVNGSTLGAWVEALVDISDI